MDASLLRLILIVVGALLILALYLWERHREKRMGRADEDRFDAFDDSDEDLGDEDLDVRNGMRSGASEPHFAAYDDDEDDLAYEQPRESSWSHARQGDGNSLDDAADFDSEDPSAESPKPVMDTSQPDPLLIQVSVSARRYPFRGSDVMEVADRCGLYPGEMDIFHCLDEFDDRTRVYFSMANMVKPGTFPFDNMETFSTPGLMLFAQLEGDPEDMTILDEMVATARKLALALNGDVLDDKRSPLTVTKEEAMRQAVLDNETRWARTRLR
jgi:cell division protein ZipA